MSGAAARTGKKRKDNRITNIKIGICRMQKKIIAFSRVVKFNKYISTQNIEDSGGMSNIKIVFNKSTSEGLAGQYKWQYIQKQGKRRV